jgi:hypothetical protein
MIPNHTVKGLLCPAEAYQKLSFGVSVAISGFEVNAAAGRDLALGKALAGATLGPRVS